MNNLLNYFSEEELNNIKKCNNLKEKCLIIINRLFLNRVDKADKPYIDHLTRVSSNFDDELVSSAALLHDTIEDIKGITEYDLLDVGIPNKVIDIVLLVTRKKDVSYDEFINKIIDSNNIDAVNLKIADIMDNLNPNRLELLDDDIINDLKEKYNPQLKKLKEKRNKYDRY